MTAPRNHVTAGLLGILLLLDGSAFCRQPDPIRAVDVFVMGSDRFTPGSRTILRVLTFGATSVFDSSPIPLAEVSIVLEGGGRPAETIFRGRGDLLGVLEASFEVPDWAPGSYRMEVRSETPFGHGAVERIIRIEKTSLALLTVDREVSHPGGRPIGLRVLLLQEADRSPVANEPVRFELRDPEGAVILARRVSTNPFGIASSDLEPDPGTRPGLYQIGVLPAGQPETFAPVFRTLRIAAAEAGRPATPQAPSPGPAAAPRTEALRANGRPAAGLEKQTPVEADPKQRLYPKPGGPATPLFFPGMIQRPAGGGADLRLRTEKAILEPGETLRGSIQSTPATPIVFLDLTQGDVIRLARTVVLEAGEGHFALVPGPDLFGMLELRTTSLRMDGSILRDTLPVYLESSRKLTLTIFRDRSVVRPGQEVNFRIRITDPGGRRRAAALGIAVAEENDVVSGAIPSDLEVGPAGAGRHAAGSLRKLAALIQSAPLSENEQALARTILARVPLAEGAGLWSNPRADRLRKARADAAAFRESLTAWMKQHRAVQRGPDGRWHYRPGLLDAMRAGKALPEGWRLDPLGDAYTLAKLGDLWPELRAESMLASQEAEHLRALRSRMVAILQTRTDAFVHGSPPQWEGLLEHAFRVAVQASDQPPRDVSGQPLDWMKLHALPGFTVQDFLEPLHAARIRPILGALRRYGAEGERWYRISVLDRDRNAYAFPRGAIERVIRRGYLRPQDGVDIWGHPFRLLERADPPEGASTDRLRFVEIRSDGPDGIPDTPDDLSSHNKPGADLDRLALIRALGFQAPEMGPFPIDVPAAPIETSTHPSTGDPDRVPGIAPPSVAAGNLGSESLLFVPALITDENGEATLRIAVPDRPATWRMTLSASSLDGSLGSGVHRIKVLPGP